MCFLVCTDDKPWEVPGSAKQCECQLQLFRYSLQASTEVSLRVKVPCISVWQLFAMHGYLLSDDACLVGLNHTMAYHTFTPANPRLSVSTYTNKLNVVFVFIRG